MWFDIVSVDECPHTGPGYLLYELADALLEDYYEGDRIGFRSH